MTADRLLSRLGLTSEERLLVMLYYTERLSIAEVAAVLGITNHRAAAMQRQLEARAKQLIDDDNPVPK